MGTYNYPARELADKINNLLNSLEGDFASNELQEALRLVAVEHRLAADGGKHRRLLRRVEALAWTIIESSGKGYISSNDVDFANDCLNKAMEALQKPAAAKA